MTDKKKILILHDYFNIKGGGEKLVMLLAEYLNADICFGFVGETTYSLDAFEKNQLINLNARSVILGWISMKLLRAFARKTDFLRDYEIAVFSGVSSISAVHNHPFGRNILYCHSLPRYIYDLREFYGSHVRWWQRPFLYLLVHYVRPRYEHAVAKMDTIVVNSKNVQKRVKHYLRRDAYVIYPPVETEKFQYKGQGDYYLSTARVDPCKRVGQIVQAFMQMPEKKLIVVSGGSELRKLKKIAQKYSNIQFTGWCDDQQLVDLVGNAIATIYLPIDEDFGISPVESMASGKPVIGVAEGGLLETVLHGETGILVEGASIDKIKDAVTYMSPDVAISMRNACEQRAQLFRKEIFFEKMNALILHTPR